MTAASAGIHGWFCRSSQVVRLDELTVREHGAQLFRAALTTARLVDLERVLAAQPTGQAGVRLSNVSALGTYLESAGPVGCIPASFLREACFPVRAVLFDKSASRNWSLAWHQDRTIVVKQRLDVHGFGPWSSKGGLIHVEPPFELLAMMLTLRVHLDAVPSTNGPLLIAPGSHRRGRIAEPEVARIVEECGVVSCLAEAGDVWLYATPILHASAAAVSPFHRRVLQVDYAARPLPHGLQWLGVT